MVTPKLHKLYKVENVSNGEFYIGVTCKGLRTRLSEHFILAETNRFSWRFHKAIRKYGRGAFRILELATFENRTMANRAEIDAIRHMRPVYNATSGGEGVAGVPRTREWSAKISASLRGRALSDERRNVARKFMAMAHESNRKPIVCLNDGMRHASLLDAAAHYGVRAKSISESLSGRQRFAGKLAFVLESNYRGQKISDVVADRKALRDKTGALRGKRVRCLETGRVFSSCREAERALGLPTNRVSPACRGILPKVLGLSFRYVDDTTAWQSRKRTADQLDAAKEIRVATLAEQWGKKRRAVIHLDTGMVYPSVTDAAKALRKSIGTVWSACARENSRRNSLKVRFLSGQL